jgi:hypothetical protein
VTESKKRAKDNESRSRASKAETEHAKDDKASEDRDAAGGHGFADALDHERLRLGSPTDAVLSALLEVGPDAVDHLLKAAQELLLAAKAVVDAGERAVESHRQATEAAGRMGDAPGSDPRVRRIDLA